MFYRESGQFKTTYQADQALLPIAQDRWFIMRGSGCLGSETPQDATRSSRMFQWPVTVATSVNSCM